MSARGTLFVAILRPMQGSAVTHFTEVTRKWLDFEETQKREEFPNPILYRCPRKAPLVGGFQREASTGDTGSTLFDTMRFVKDETVVIDGMDNAFTISMTEFRLKVPRCSPLTIFFDNSIRASPPFRFFPINRFKSRIYARSQNYSFEPLLENRSPYKIS